MRAHCWSIDIFGSLGLPFPVSCRKDALRCTMWECPDSASPHTQQNNEERAIHFFHGLFVFSCFHVTSVTSVFAMRFRLDEIFTFHFLEIFLARYLPSGAWCPMSLFGRETRLSDETLQVGRLEKKNLLALAPHVSVR